MINDIPERIAAQFRELMALKSGQATDGKAIIPGYFHQFSTSVNVNTTIAGTPNVYLNLASDSADFAPQVFVQITNSTNVLISPGILLSPGKGKNLRALAQGFVLGYAGVSTANVLFSVFADQDFTGGF